MLIVSYSVPTPTSSVCPLACAAMIPAMAVGMLFRLDVYKRGDSSPGDVNRET